MEHPNLGELKYFTIPPNFTRSDLEIKLDERGLLSHDKVNMALNSIAELAASKGIPLRNSGASTLDEHIYPVTALVLEFLSFEMNNGNSKFTPIPPEAAIVPLLHETFDSQQANREKIERGYGKKITKMLWTLGDMGYIGTMKENTDYWSKSPEDKYREKTQMKFDAIKHAPKIVQATCLADRLNNTLCLYSGEYLENRIPTQRMHRAINIVVDIALPVANEISPDFFAPMFRQVLAYHKKKYHASFGTLQF